MATSYINEHSAEFYIVPHLKCELENHFKYVAPVMPWLNRETSKISKKLHGSDQFKMLIVFPRRPKLEVNNTEKIFITVNPELITFNQFAAQKNIPVIMACPIASNFWDLSKDSKSVWIKIFEQQTENYMYLLQSSNSSDSVLPRISINELAKQIKNCVLFNVDSLFAFIKESRDLIPGNFIYGPRYKPVYFLIKEH